jgi:hypothetical protein
MFRSLRLKLGLILISTATCVFVSILFFAASRLTPQERLRRTVAEELPIGTDRQVVHEWLSRKQILYCALPERPPDRVDWVEGKSVLVSAGLDAATPIAYTRGTVWMRPSLFNTTVIQVYFFFDKEDKLVKHFVCSWEEGL